MSLALTSRRAALMPGQWVRNELWRRAKAVPSLDLRFADNKSLVDAVTGASLVTFTRASSATYVDSQGVIQTAATDVPRFDHNPTTGESLGLLVEEQRTNLLTYSEDTSQWLTPANVTLTQNATTAPDDASTADQYIETSATGLHVQDGMPFAFVTSTVYSYSVFVKAIGDRNFEIGFPVTIFTNRFARFTLSGVGAIQGTDAGVTATIQSFANGWYRCAATSTCVSSTSSRISNFVNNASYSRNYAGDTSKGIYIWGAQLEAAAFPTSYIPTTSAAVTRSADVASITGTAFSSWYQQGVGTLSAEYIAPPAIQNANTCSISDGTTNNRVTIRAINPSNQTSFFVINGSVTQVGQTIAGPLNGVVNTSVIAFADNDVAMTKNTLGIFTDTSATIPTNLDQFKIGADGNGGFFHNNIISRLTYWPQRLPNSSLQAITQ